MQRVTFLFLICLIAFTSLTSVSAAGEEKACSAIKFEVSLPETATFENFKVKQAPLLLASAGMRKKSLVVMSVDVYKVGVYLSADKDKAVGAAVTAGKGFELAAPLSGKDDSISVGIVLQFVRNVATSAVVDV